MESPSVRASHYSFLSLMERVWNTLFSYEYGLHISNTFDTLSIKTYWLGAFIETGTPVPLRNILSVTMVMSSECGGTQVTTAPATLCTVSRIVAARHHIVATLLYLTRTSCYLHCSNSTSLALPSCYSRRFTPHFPLYTSWFAACR